MPIRAGQRTKSVAVANFSPPAAHQMHLVLGNGCHFWIPLPYELRVFVHLVGLNVVEDN